MIKVELPVLYAENFEEIEEAEKIGNKIKVIEVMEMTTFWIPDNCIIKLNSASEKKRTTLYLDDASYIIDSDYETVLELFNRAIR